MSSGNRCGKKVSASRVPQSQRSQGVKRTVNNGSNYNSNLGKNTKNEINHNNVPFRLSSCNYPLEFVGLPRQD